ncbi:hypothetical protein TYRP_005800 [Tyrophagus putrescentiae]|nr:hypothetical protein TYRP_005800 [Tyrophagus putrescentiae]
MPAAAAAIAGATVASFAAQTPTRTFMPAPLLLPLLLIAPAGALCFGGEDHHKFRRQCHHGFSHSRIHRMTPALAHRAEDHHHHHHLQSTSAYAASAWSVSTALSSLHICWVIKRSGPSRYYCPPSDVGGPKRTVDKDGRLSEDGDEDGNTYLKRKKSPKVFREKGARMRMMIEETVGNEVMDAIHPHRVDLEAGQGATLDYPAVGVAAVVVMLRAEAARAASSRFSAALAAAVDRLKSATMRKSIGNCSSESV